MNIHEYQAKQLLRAYDIPLLSGHFADSAESAQAAAEQLLAQPDCDLCVVKSQIHAGGRGAGHFKGAADDKGGVRLARSTAEAKQHAAAMLNQLLITKQTGAKGKLVQRLYVEAGCAIAAEFYLSLLIDRSQRKIVIVASSAGGMDIEAVAAATPEKIATIAIDLATGVMPYHARQLAECLGLKLNHSRELQRLLTNLFKAFVATDAALIEINPLVLTEQQQLIALDAKMSFDDNASFRQTKIIELADPSEQDPMELAAQENELSYIKLDGSIGCMVNGAGLAMATMDLILLKGSNPANFLDVGGSATQERISKAFEIICSDRNVKGILINIFGGIMRCDIVARGIVAAAAQMQSQQLPLVVRLEGTNVEQGKKIMAESKLAIIAANDLDDAANKIVTACGKS